VIAASTVGPMATTIKTCAAYLSVIAGKDAKDPLTKTIPFDTIPDYVAACRADALIGARVGKLVCI